MWFSMWTVVAELCDAALRVQILVLHIIYTVTIVKQCETCIVNDHSFVSPSIDVEGLLLLLWSCSTIA